MSTIAESPTSLAIRGIATLVFGIIAITMPVSAFWALVFVFGAYALIDGISALSSAIMRPRRDGRGWLVVEGIAGILAAIVTVFWPAAAALVLIACVSAWAFVTGIVKIVLAIKLRREIRGEWLLIVSGVASIILGALLLATPLTATLALVWTLGIYAFVSGALMIALSLRVQHWERSLIQPSQRAA